MDPLRRPLLAANWKMHFTTHEATAAARRLRAGVAQLGDVEVVVAPPFTALASVAKALSGGRVHVAAQNMHPRADGAFTGEVSGAMLRDVGATWVLLGHSERRTLFHETDADVAAKLASAVEQGFAPIVCVGESLEARRRGDALDVVHGQLAALGATIAIAPSIAIAYEPLWAMGTGESASASDIEPMHRAIRAHLARIDPELAVRARIVYGGPFTPDDALAFLDAEDVDGVLVGMPAVDLEAVVAIARLADRLARGAESILAAESTVEL